MKTKRSTMIIVGLILSVVGILLLVLGVILIIQHVEKGKKFVKTEGIVIGFETSGGIDSNLNDNYFYDDVEYAPIVEYFVKEKRYEATHTSSSSPPEYYLGDIVALRYNPNNPEEVIFVFKNNFWIISLVGTVFACCGLPMTFIGIFKKNKSIKNS